MIRQVSGALRRKDSLKVDETTQVSSSDSSESLLSDDDSLCCNESGRFVTTGEDASDTTTTRASSLILLAAPIVCAILGLAFTPKFLVLALVYLATAAKTLIFVALNLTDANTLNAMIRNSLKSHRSLTVQFTMLATCLFLYERSRVLVMGNAGEQTVHAAFNTAKQIILTEHALGLDFEPTLQAMLIDHGWLVWIGNGYYAVMHFIVPLGVMACLLIGNRDSRFQHRSSFFLMLALALVIFVMLPTMPPRLLERYRREYSPEFSDDVSTVLNPYWSIVDTMAKSDTLYDKLHKEGGNPYAAMPSMHTGWALWSALVAVDTLPYKGIAWMAACHVFFTVFFIMLTGNHFWLDAVGGAFCTFFGRHVAAKVTQPSSICKKNDEDQKLARAESSESSREDHLVVSVV